MRILQNSDGSPLNVSIVPPTDNPAFKAIPINGYAQAPSAPVNAAAPVAGSQIVAPVANPAAQAVLPVRPNVRDSMPSAPSAAEIMAEAQKAYKEPGNGWSAFSQGWSNAQAVQDKQDRTSYDEEKKLLKAEAEKQKQVDYLRRVSPDYASAVEAGVMSAQDAYKDYKTSKAKKDNVKFSQLKDGTYGYFNEDTKVWTPLGGSANQEAEGFRFGGNSVEAQSLNGLMDSGQLTPDQAQQLGAGKTITGPNGEIIFMTPQGVFGQPAQGGAPQPIGGAPAPTDGADVVEGAPPTQSQPPAATQQRNGLIPLTSEKVTIDENKAAGFADRMEQAEQSLAEVPDAAFGLSGTIGNMVADNDYIPDALESTLMSGDFQQYDQARRNFINAQMRRESGAVIGKDEFSNANKQYFPMPGDNKDTIKKKAENRRTAASSMKRDAGPTYGRKDGGGEADPLGIR